jgi:hypothetical protein
MRRWWRRRAGRSGREGLFPFWGWQGRG